jgi:hypothetical protein
MSFMGFFSIDFDSLLNLETLFGKFLEQIWANLKLFTPNIDRKGLEIGLKWPEG